MKLMKHYRQHASFYRDLWIIALPIALQQLVTSSLNMVDTLMVGRVGVDAVAAVGVSNQYYFLLNMVMLNWYLHRAFTIFGYRHVLCKLLKEKCKQVSHKCFDLQCCLDCKIW